jgi:hypothetical protein
MEGRILDYGPVPTNQKRWFRRTVRIIVLLGIVAGIYFLGPPTWRWTQFLYWQNRCLGYTAPPNHVVFDYDVPNCTIKSCDSQLACSIIDPNFLGEGTVFLHEMRKPDGNTRLVWCGVYEDGSAAPRIILQHDCRELQFIPTMVKRFVPPTDTIDIPKNCQRLKVFAGQLDPADRSHFTFDYDTDGARHTVDAWLNNQDQLLISPRP